MLLSHTVNNCVCHGFICSCLLSSSRNLRLQLNLVDIIGTVAVDFFKRRRMLAACLGWPPACTEVLYVGIVEYVVSTQRDIVNRQPGELLALTFGENRPSLHRVMSQLIFSLNWTTMGLAKTRLHGPFFWIGSIGTVGRIILPSIHYRSVGQIAQA